jgi:hypothetical protein
MERRACFPDVMVLEAVLQAPRLEDARLSGTTWSDAWDAVHPAAAAAARSAHPDAGAERLAGLVPDVPEPALRAPHPSRMAEALPVVEEPDTRDAVPSEAQSSSDAALAQSEPQVSLHSEADLAGPGPKVQPERR